MVTFMIRRYSKLYGINVHDCAASFLMSSKSLTESNLEIRVFKINSTSPIHRLDSFIFLVPAIYNELG